MTAFEGARFDTAGLYDTLDEERMARGMSWSQVAEEIGVAASTMKRLAKGGRMEVDGLMFILQWLGLPAETFVRRADGSAPNLMSQIETLLRTQRELSAADAAAMQVAMRLAYGRLPRGTT